MSTKTPAKSEVLLKGGEYFGNEDTLANWLGFITDPANLSPGLPTLVLTCQVDRHSYVTQKVHVTFDETRPSLKSLRLQPEGFDKYYWKAFQDTDPNNGEETSTRPAEWIHNLFMNAELEHLDVSFANIELPDLFDYLPKLKTLRLNNSKLRRLPQSFFRMSELVSLDISGCNFEQVPADLGDMPMLQRLAFSQPVMPSVLSSLHSLTALTCKCPAFDVPQEITQLTNLVSLSLCDVRSAPENFLNFRKLEHLHLHAAKDFSDLKFREAHVPALTELITNFPAAFVRPLSEFRKLERFTAGQGSLTETERDELCNSLKQLDSLTHVSLSGLGITDIDFCLAHPKLSRADLSDNKISRLPADLTKLSELEFIDLTGNEIKDVPIELEDLYQSGRLRLDNNPIETSPDRLSRNKVKRDRIEKGGTHLITIETGDSIVDWLTYLTDQSNLRPGLPDFRLQLMRSGRVDNDVSVDVSFDPDVASLSSLKIRLTQHLKKSTSIFLNRNASADTPRTWIRNLFEHPGLKELHVPFMIDELPDRFDALGKLEHADFSGSGIKKLPLSFCRLSSLNMLTLDNSPLTELPGNFNLLSNLVTLSLRNTQITKIPEGLFSLQRLETLFMDGTRIDDLPDLLGGLPALKNLSLNAEKLSDFPSSLFELVALENLHLDGLSISALPDEFHHLNKLKRLTLRGNFSELPASLFEITALEELDLSGVPIARLPDQFDLLVNLKRISLNGTAITHLPESFFRLSALEWLNVAGTSITELPTEIGKLKTLRHLSFSQTCPPEVWPELSELTSLDCYCPDFHVPVEFSVLRKLKNLRLKSVTHAEHDALNLPALETLELKRSTNYTPFTIKADLPNLNELTTNYIELFYPSIKDGALKNRNVRIIT